jgi:hypothetical protein
MRYLKSHNKLFEAVENTFKEIKLPEDVVNDLEYILVDMDLADRPTDFKNQEIKFKADTNIISIYGSRKEPFLLSTVDDTIDRVVDYIDSIGCKCAVTYIGKDRTLYNRQIFDIATGVSIKITLNNYMMLRSTYNASNYYMLYKGDDIIVVLSKNINMYRTYYIAFKNVRDKNSIYSSLKMVYNSNSRNFINFKVYDNHNNEIKWNSLSEHLRKGGIDYSVFNNGFGYTEADFNNQGYE